MPFLFGIIYFVFIVPACVISSFVENLAGDKIGKAVWWIIIHAILYSIFIAIPLWLLFDVSVLTNVIIFAILEMICFAMNTKK